MSYMDFSSWPRDQEQTFVVYEQRTKESATKALTLGTIVGAIMFFVAIGIYAGVSPEERDLAKDMNMSNLTKGREGAPAPAPAPAPKSEAPKTDAPKTDTPKTDTPKAEDSKAGTPKAESKEAPPAEKAPDKK